MVPEWTQMVSATEQIKTALRDLGTEIPYSVFDRWIRRQDKGNIITVTEITNVQSSQYAVVDRLGYQVDIWAEDRETAETLYPLVNAAITGIGFRRDGWTPPEPFRDPSNYYRAILRFARNVDKRSGRLID